MANYPQTFEEQSIERSRDKMLGLDIYEDPEEREEHRQMMIDRFLRSGARCSPTRAGSALSPYALPCTMEGNVGQHPRIAQRVQEKEKSAETRGDALRGVADLAADAAGFMGDTKDAAVSADVKRGAAETTEMTEEDAAMEARHMVAQLLSRERMNGRDPVKDIKDYVSSISQLAPVGAPTQRSPRTLGVATEDMNMWHRLEAHIRSKVPETIDPSLERIITREAIVLGIGWQMASAMGISSVSGRVLVGEGGAGAVAGMMRNPEKDSDFAALLAQLFAETPEIAWLADRDGSPAENRLKNAVEGYLEYAGVGLAVEGAVKLARAFLSGLRGIRQKADTPEAKDGGETPPEATEETGEISPVSGEDVAEDTKRMIDEAFAEFVPFKQVVDEALEAQDTAGGVFHVEDEVREFLGDYLGSQAKYGNFPHLAKVMDDLNDPNSALSQWLGDSAVRHPVLSGTTKWFDVSEFKGGWEESDAVAWFSDDLMTAGAYADLRTDIRTPANPKGIIPAVVKFDNPLIVKGEGRMWDDLHDAKLYNRKGEDEGFFHDYTNTGETFDVISGAKFEGFDSVIFEDIEDVPPLYQGHKIRGNVYVAMNPDQIRDLSIPEFSYSSTPKLDAAEAADPEDQDGGDHSPL